MSKETVSEFNDQWALYQHEGISDRAAYFSDVLGPLMNISELKDKTVADIGAGNGRFTDALAQVARQVISVEPGKDALLNNRARNSKHDNIIFLNTKSEEIETNPVADYVFCIGVLHHIPDMEKALRGMLKLLKEDGKLVLWVYGKEGNRIYLSLLFLLKAFSTVIPDKLLMIFSRILVVPMKMYLFLCRSMRFLPLSSYFINVIGKLNRKEIELVIFDQLNPSTARYLSKKEIEALLNKVGFNSQKFFHRHKYSWTVLAGK